MSAFRFSRDPVDLAALRAELADPACGGYAAFEGWVRNHNEGHAVTHLEYEAFEPLAIKEGERIVAEARERFGVERAACVHRIGDLGIGELAVWVGVSARHRHEAFLACRYVIDEVKHRVPIWKKEHYVNGDSGWVNCERCATAAPQRHEPGHAHGHGHAHEHGHSREHGHSHGCGPAHAPAQAATGHEAGAAVALVPDYSRQMALKEVGARGQARLRASRVLVVGAGGLGVPVLTYLAGAGIGRIGIVDGDRLDPSNLHRQTLYALADVGKPKAELAAARLRALNPDVDVQAHLERLDRRNGAELIGQYDLVIDCTDNFTTKFLLNDLCVQHRRAAVFSSVYQYEGQLQVLRGDLGEGPCLRCVWPEATPDGVVGNCAEAGVLGPVPGVFGSLQALEALKLLLDLPGQLRDDILVLDLLTLSTSRIRASRARACRGGPCTRTAAALAETPVEAAELELALESLDQALEQGFEIVDVREPAEVAADPTPVARALHIPLAELLHGVPQLPEARKHLLVCASGRRSLAAARALRGRGLPHVYSLRDGVLGLKRRSLT